MKQKLKTTPKLLIAILMLLVIAQSFFIVNLYNSKDDKIYQVNLVKINHEKDSMDYLSLKTNLQMIDESVRDLNQNLKSKNLEHLKLESLEKDKLANKVYLSQSTSRYSQYLVDLELKLQESPIGKPIDSYISSVFGERKNPIPKKTIAAKPIKSNDSLASNGPKIAEEPEQKQFHKGLDFGAPHGSDVACTANGDVIFSGPNGGYGNCVIVRHKNGLSTLYAHLSSIAVKVNEKINIGQIVGKVGSTGRSTGPHLHYEVRKNNTPINPKIFLGI